MGGEWNQFKTFKSAVLEKQSSLKKREKIAEIWTSVPQRRLAGPKNLLLFSTYAFSYDGCIENFLQSDEILFSDQAIATTVPYRRTLFLPYIGTILETYTLVFQGLS